MSGTAVAQGIGFAMTPVISRLFSPTDFGVFGSFNSVLYVVAAMITLQYSQAIILPKQDKEAANVFGSSVLSVILITLICFVIAFVFSDWLLELLNINQSRWILYFLPLGLFFNGINQSFQAWCVRRKVFKKIAASQMIRSGSNNSLQIISGLFQSGGGGLIVSSVTADGIASWNFSRHILGVDKGFLKKSMDWKKIWQSAIKYRDFPFYSATQNMMNALSQGLPVLLLAHFFGVSVAGAYAFGIRLIQVPMNFILTALRQVLFQKASETYNRGGVLLPLYLKFTSGLFLLILPPATIIFVWGPQIFSWIFGIEWFKAGFYAKWLVFWLVPGFCNVPSILFARILRKQKKLFVLEILVLISRALVLVLGGYFLSANNTVILFSVTGAIINGFYILWVGMLLLKLEKNIKYKVSLNGK